MLIIYLMKQIQYINVEWFLMQMLLKQFVNSCFYEKRVIYSNTANSSLVNKKYRTKSWIQNNSFNIAITIKIARKIKVDNFLYNYMYFFKWGAAKNSKLHCLKSQPIIFEAFQKGMARTIWISYCPSQYTNLDRTKLSLRPICWGQCSIMYIFVFCDLSWFHLNFNIKQNIIISCIIA